MMKPVFILDSLIFYSHLAPPVENGGNLSLVLQFDNKQQTG